MPPQTRDIRAFLFFKILIFKHLKAGYACSRTTTRFAEYTLRCSLNENPEIAYVFWIQQFRTKKPKNPMRSLIHMAIAISSLFLLPQSGSAAIKANTASTLQVPGNNVQRDLVPPSVSALSRRSPYDTISNMTSFTFRLVFNEPVIKLNNSFVGVYHPTTLLPGNTIIQQVNDRTFDIRLDNVSGYGWMQLYVYDSLNAIRDLQGNTLPLQRYTSNLFVKNAVPKFNNNSTSIPITLCGNTTYTKLDSILSTFDGDSQQRIEWTIRRAARGRVNGLPAQRLLPGNQSVQPANASYTPPAGFTGLDTVFVQVSDGLSTDSLFVAFNVLPQPALGGISGASTACVGEQKQFSTTGTSQGVWAFKSWSTNDPSLATIDQNGVLRAKKSGTAIVRFDIADPNGCAQFAQQSITLYPIPAKPSISRDLGSVILKANINTGIQWFDAGVRIQNATKQEFTPGKHGRYSVTQTLNGCTSAPSDEFLFVESSFAYPNPARDVLNIQLPSDKQKMAIVQIADISWRVLMEKEVQLNKGQTLVQFNILNLSKGIYRLIIKTENNEYKQFAKE